MQAIILEYSFNIIWKQAKIVWKKIDIKNDER